VLALRSNLLIRGHVGGHHEAAASSLADAVTFDLAAPETHGERGALREAAQRALPVVAAAGRGAHVRVADARSGELDADLEATVSASLQAVLLSGAETPQDARDADVGIRHREMEHGVEPGSVRLISEIDSAGGVRALGGILDAIDRHTAVALNIELLAHDLGLSAHISATMPVLEHAMAEVALGASAAGLPWVLLAPHIDPGVRAPLANRAHALGAAGSYVRSEAEAPGYNQLFTLQATEVELAREVVAEWERLRANSLSVGAVGDVLVDRRTVRRARSVLATAEAIRRRSRAN
jgi:citrate lyase subunit beta/citryl-CoA lyase